MEFKEEDMRRVREDQESGGEVLQPVYTETYYLSLQHSKGNLSRTETREMPSVRFRILEPNEMDLSGEHFTSCRKGEARRGANSISSLGLPGLDSLIREGRKS